MSTASIRPNGHPGFLREAGAGFVVSVLGAILLAALPWLVAPDVALRFVIAAVGGVTVLRILSRGRTGRVVLFGIWTGATAICWLAPLPLPAYAAAHAGLLWFLKCVHARPHVLEAATNAGITLLALASAAWASAQTHSPFLAFWCFFLVCALSTLIRNPLSTLTGSGYATPKPLDRFDAAHRAAKSALAELTSTH
jgi:hypothetical protein